MKPSEIEVGKPYIIKYPGMQYMKCEAKVNNIIADTIWFTMEYFKELGARCFTAKLDEFASWAIKEVKT